MVKKATKTDTTKMDQGLTSEWKIFAVAGGFYFYGKLVEAPPGYLALTEASMFGGFGGGFGLPGVARGHEKATVVLDRFAPSGVQSFPVENVYAVFTSVSLYDFSGAEVRN